ncbi:MAG: DUF1018 domain-containing protein [Ignavibacteriae bacterium]|nr:DUF1018 domain-containing protein [Candidatus Andersenbacteria bacterium]MCB0713415.1 DUF1018 domain-containing protein [Ignavibacteriota bacterium]MCB9216121.1 DUF1018 domain-containing protein [Ignavibacteria bacterium]
MSEPLSTNEQKRQIHILASSIGIEDEDRRADMQEMYGVRSSKDLSYGQADEYILHLEKRAMASGVLKHPNRRQKAKKYDDLGNRPGMASPGQMRLIEYQWSRVSYYIDPVDRARALNHFLHKRFKRSGITMLEWEMVPKVIHALEAMYAQKVREAEVAT